MDRRRDTLAIAAALLLLCVTVIGVAGSLHWIDKPFAGFFLLDNQVIASAGLAGWPTEIYQHEVVAVDGEPLLRASRLDEYVASLPLGSEVTYTLRQDGNTFDYVLETRLFTLQDYLLLFGALIFCGLGLGIVAVLIRLLCRDRQLSTGTMLPLLLAGTWSLSANDLYGPYRLFPVHALVECFLFAGALHMAAVFPHPWAFVRKRPGLVAAPYLAGGLLGAVTLSGLYEPSVYVVTHRTAMLLFGLSLAIFILSQIHVYWRPPSFEDRQRVKVVVLGTVATLLPQVVLLAGSALSGGRAPENVLGWTGVFFPVAVGYAVLRDDLLEVDSFLRRSFSYAILTTVVAAIYVGAVATFGSLLHDPSQTRASVFAVLFASISVILILPLRDYLQANLNRVFFRSSYDFRRLVETTSARLASISSLEELALELEQVVNYSLHPEWIALNVRRSAGAELEYFTPTYQAPLLTPEVIAEAETSSTPISLPNGALALPFRVEDRLVALLRVGPSLSGRYYSGEDRRLLQTLANQGAVAIQNALVLDQMRELNRDLEKKVDERTRALSTTLDELRETQTHLVHQEKMASVGQLVAGIAHEINNPVNFIQGNLHFLREYTGQLLRSISELEAAAAERDPRVGELLRRVREQHDLDFVAEDLESTLQACEDGVTRTTNIVKGLRTFSRADDVECSAVDLHDALDSTLTLLRSPLTGIQVIRVYDDALLPIHCLAGEINQVLMNLLANAADAAGDGGTICVRTRQLGPARVCVEIQDSGPGIDPAQRDRIFEPFFTTKAVGHGTGLGLAISYGIVVRHSGTISVLSETGHGALFRVELPVEFTPAQADRSGRRAQPAQASDDR